MRGHVEKKKDNWYVVLELDPVDGARRQKWISVRKELGLNRRAKKTEADKLLIKLLKELQDGTYFEPTEDSLAKCLELWLENHVRVNCKQKTIDFYENLIYNHINPEIGRIPAAKLRPIDIQKLLTKKAKSGRNDGKPGGLSRRTVQGIKATLKKALGDLVDWEQIAHNPATKIKQKRQKTEKKKPAAWSKEEVATFLNYMKAEKKKMIDIAAADAWLMERGRKAPGPAPEPRLFTVSEYAKRCGRTVASVYQWIKEGLPVVEVEYPRRLYPLYLLALTTGMRMGEILGLRWSDISFAKATISIRQNLVETKKGIQINTPKTEESERTIDISPKLVKALKTHKRRQAEEFMTFTPRPDHDLVFSSETGGPISPRNLSRNFSDALKKLDGKVKRITFHNLRDTHATRLIEEGVHIKAVAERLGHADEVTLLRRYAHALPKISKEAAVKMDSLIPE